MSTPAKLARLNLRMTEEDRAYTEALVEALGMSDMSTLMRWLVRQQCRHLGVEPKATARKRRTKGG